MEIQTTFLHLTAICWLSSATSQDTQPTTIESTTENLDFPTIEPTTKLYSTTATNQPEGKEEEPFTIEEQTIVSFPENHKNFTPSQYLGSEEYPPYYNFLNPYQQQYKEYFEQKQIYNTKPIKFEEDSVRNTYLPTGEPNALESGNGKKVARPPFPYVFDTDRQHEQGSWYKNTEHTVKEQQEQDSWYKNPEQGYRVQQEANEQYKHTEHTDREQQEKVKHLFLQQQENWYKTLQHGMKGHENGYFVSPHGHLQDDKLYKYEPIHYDYRQGMKEGKGNPWKKVFHVLTALVPLGLLLATLTPNVISINSTATTKTSRQRSEDQPPFQFKEEDILRLMKKQGVSSLAEGQCEDRIICELAREGSQGSSGSIEKGIWFLANQTPWDLAEKAGMNDLFKAIKSGNCEVFKCNSRMKLRKDSWGKKLIRRHTVKE